MYLILQMFLVLQVIFVQKHYLHRRLDLRFLMLRLLRRLIVYLQELFQFFYYLVDVPLIKKMLQSQLYQVYLWLFYYLQCDFQSYHYLLLLHHLFQNNNQLYLLLQYEWMLLWNFYLYELSQQHIHYLQDDHLIILEMQPHYYLKSLVMLYYHRLLLYHL